ncbi:tudor domain-containing protein 7 tapas isoform X2 [Cotesia typhae]|uniref:tudor domain-containing protein 7 tapas isoform X2 n=1 Tax=Cotesia typhae TaxID=2053667 RepID=UPI003D6825BD
MEEIGKTLKSMLLAYKGGVAVENINRDYKDMFEEYIPFRKYGYANILEFLKDVPTIRLVSRNGTIYAQALVDEKNKHLADLISKQKTSKSKPTSSRRPTNTYSGNYNRSSSAGRFSSNSRPNFSARYGRSQSLHRPTDSRNWSSNSNSRPETTRAQNFSSNGSQKKPDDRFYMPKPQNGFQQSSSMSRAEKPEADRVPARANNGFQNQSSSTSPPMNYRVSNLHNISMGRNSQAQNMSASSSAVTRQNSSGNIPPLIPPTDLRDRKSPVSPTNSSLKPKSLSPNYSSKTNDTFNDSGLKPQLKPLSERLKNPLAFSSPFEAKQTETSTTDKRVTFAPSIEVKINTSPVIRQLSLPLTPPVTPKTFNDPREELTDLAFQMSLPPPEYVCTDSGKRNPKTIYSQITIGSMKFSSYPADAKTKNDAEIIAAEQALADLRVKYQSQVQLPITVDKSVIKERIIDIVINDNHTSGIFKHKLPQYYQEKYKETLPLDWDDVIASCSAKITCEKVLNDGIILLPYNPATDDIDQPPMPELVLPQEELWPVYITSLISTEEVYGIILDDDYCLRRDAMTDKIEVFYSKVQPKPASVKVKRYYAVKKDDIWQRVYVDFIDTESESADVFFIDTGDVDTVSLNDLCILDMSFYELAPQAVRFSIAGYDELSSYNVINKIGVELLTNLSCYVQVMSREKNDLGVLINGVFYDTSTDEDININDLILEKLIKTVSSPKLISEGEVLEVYLSHVDEETGGVFIQINNDSFEVLNALIEKLTSEINEEVIKRAAVKWNWVTRDVAYLARLEEGPMARAKVIQQPQGDRLNVLLVDVGKTMVVTASQILRIQMIPPAHDNNFKLLAAAVEKFPVQTCGIQLHNTRTSVLSDKKILKPLREMAPPKVKLFCKVIKEAKKDSLAVVELFKRGGKDKDYSLISINNTLALQLINSEDEDKNNNLKPKSRIIDRKNSRSNLLPKGLEIMAKPEIPKVGEFFDVHVTQTVTGPSHFVVQPYHGTEALIILEEELQSYCEGNKGFVKNENFGTVESLCAAKVDNKWQRAMVAGVFDARSTIVYLCDSGVMRNLDNSHEQLNSKPQLDSKFKELVGEKDFVSIIRKIEPDTISPTKQIVSLELIDTSGSKDKNILSELMKLDIF